MNTWPQSSMCLPRLPLPVQHLPAPTALLSSSRTCANALRKGLRRLRCLPNVARKGRPRQVSPARRTLNKFLRNAADEHDTLLYLGIRENVIYLAPNAWHLRDAPDPEGTTVWAVYEMALFRRELGVAHILVDVTPAGRAWRACIQGDPYRRGADVPPH